MANQDRVGRLFVQREGNQNIFDVKPGFTVTFPYGGLEVEDGDGTALPVHLRRVVSNAAAVFATPTVLTEGDSGTIQLCDKAAGIDFTLPAITADNVGMEFEFKIVVEPTSNSYRWTAGAADLLLGAIVIHDKDQVEGSTEALMQINRPDGSDDLICTITGSDDTQGSLVGGEVTFTAISATRWWVSGRLVGDGNLATNFS